MPSLSSPSLGLIEWLEILFLLGPLLFVATATYNLFLHPLAHIPGPFWGRASGIPSWYHALRGKRHIWLWQQFQIYGDKIRPDPNTVLFCDPDAYADIYGMKSNVRRSPFYEAFKRNEREKTTLTTIDVAAHAKKRRILNIAFTEKLVRAASGFIIKHVDRWNQLIMDEIDSDSEWSAPVDFSHKVDALIFDIMGDLCFGKSFGIKEPGDNPLKEVPHCIAEYMRFYYPMCRSPFLKLLLWLKPRGLDRLFELITPPAVQKYNEFVYSSVTSRIALQKEQAEKPEVERRQDMFYFLCDAKNPDTGLPAYDEDELRAESSLLIIAGSDTTSISLSGIFFYLTGDPRRYQNLVNEILTTFDCPEEIVHGPKLLSCQYLKACVDEGMRLTPSGPSELPRQVLPGGIQIKGEYYGPGTIVGTVPWANSRNQEVYGDPDIFRPERWIVDESTGVTKEEVSRIKANFHPFLTGPGNCIGKNLALTEILITIARTLYRLDVRRAPGSTFGGGAPELGWGARDRRQLQLGDAYISLRQGPEVQFRKRASALSETKSE
ncbi:cytochrome P450 monooxygenase-like protein [Talaromyces proteolyticus]|uniref:Cytochrome P450 monooxygenase-like protein n=1 Tax=Talaromyces proteolyticus TaxID=1131652 RepID=A0AAD4KYE6_9EURO|nr:cytochrome P450 monooxygenase-like protein [Talaromyces proteolyticus]KAH8702535.1 cytochrome P450 monooxygenase-like protein [Talaromyces proteolyticus]